MRSLSLKLTLAFVFVGLTVAVLVAFFVRQQTEQQFDRFVLDRFQEELLIELADYYETNGSWVGINAALTPGPRMRMGPNRNMMYPLTLADANRVVLVGRDRHRVGDRLTAAEMRTAVPVSSDDETVGYVLFPAPPRETFPAQGSLESQFLAGVDRAILYSALGATVIALILGLVLARTISRPVRDLTVATQMVAQGELGHQVTVRTKDELSELAHSFNQMSADLDRSKQARQQMTADIAHDLRTPTSVILGYAEALSDGHLQGSPEIFRVLHQEAQQLSRLIHDLRLLSLADTGELSLNPEPLPPGEILQRAELAFKARAAEREIVLETAVAPNLSPIFADPERMNQVITNLVSNAFRHTPAGGRVTLSADRDGADQVRLVVQDTGDGIPAKELPFIFNRFYRGDEARRPSGESGLGLAIARSIVHAHQGAITVASTVGAGTMFTITLPVYSPESD